jgi:hypothetical protein
MKKRLAHPKMLALLLVLAAPVAPVVGQPPKPITTNDALLRTMESLDSAVFDAYNRCDMEKFGSYFTADVEFYHDKSGLTLGRQSVVESVRKYICGKVRRELVAGTLEAYPMEGYGAVAMGAHRFCELGTQKCEGIAKFIHLWRNKDSVWEMTRVISYDHRAAAPN